MNVKLAPGSPEWLRTITASKIPAILGVSRWQSQYSLWMEMAGQADPAPITPEKQELFDVGHASEAAAADYWKRKNPGWWTSPGEVQFIRNDLGFPAVATVDRVAGRGAWRQIIEAKAPRMIDDEDDGIALDYTAQIIWQQFISRITRPAALVIWPHYGSPRISTVKYDAAVADQILGRVTAWHQSLESGVQPDLDNSVSTYDTVRRQHPDIDPDLDVQLDPQFASSYIAAYDTEAEATAAHRGRKTELLAHMGDAKTALVGEHIIATRSPGRGDTVTLRRNKKTSHHTIEELS